MTDLAGWRDLQVGDLDPEGPPHLKPIRVCAQMATAWDRPWLCTRLPHRDAVHAASGLDGIVIAVWSPDFLREVAPWRPSL